MDKSISIQTYNSNQSIVIPPDANGNSQNNIGEMITDLDKRRSNITKKYNDKVLYLQDKYYNHQNDDAKLKQFLDNEIAKQIQNDSIYFNQYQNKQNNQKNLFDSVVGQMRTLEKRWIVDIDQKEISPLMISHIEYVCKPITEISFDQAGIPNGYESGPKVEAIIPTKNGHHLITKRFDVQAFKEKYPDVDIQKKNPTLLYYPNSLDQNANV